MANFKIKLFVILFFSGLIFNFNPAIANENIPRTQIVDYEEIYERLQQAEFEYIFGLDPNQPEEYTKYMYSPYPLFRSGVSLIFKSITIPPGYYLLTPREKDGKTWVLFKENGKISYVIPVYEEDIVPESFWEDKFPHPRLNPIQKTSKKTMEFIGKKWGKKNQRTPIPKAYVEFNDKGEFWDMILYVGSKSYRLLFKKG